MAALCRFERGWYLMKRLIVALALFLGCQPVAANPPLEPDASLMEAAMALEAAEAQPQLKTIILTDKPSKVAQVVLDVAITDEAARALENSLQSLPGDLDYVLLVIDSPGGLLSASRDMARIIESHPQRLACIVDGVAASGAYYILQSCSMRMMTSRSNLMLHEAFSGGAPQTANEAAALMAINASMAYQQCHRLKMSVGDCHARYSGGREWWMTPEQALAAGAIDTIVDTPMQVMLALGEAQPPK
jgi:ATP-dependent protease ClpP protease subunit